MTIAIFLAYVGRVSYVEAKGNLNSLLHGDTKVELSMYRKLLFALEMAQGMNWLHCSVPVIVHRDLKPANLLLSEVPFEFARSCFDTTVVVLSESAFAL